MTPDPIKIIYVEDEPAIAELLRSGLDLFGVEVTPIYGSGEDSLQHILSGEPPISDCHLMVFDIRLPGNMSGLEVAKALRDAGESRPILIVSAYQAPPPSQLQSLNAHFMPKPFDFNGIYNKIRELLA